MATKRASKKAPTFAVGSQVRFRFGVEDVVATIIEDRGNIGYQGRHLLRVRFQFPDAGDPFELEMPAEELKPVAA